MKAGPYVQQRPLVKLCVGENGGGEHERRIGDTHSPRGCRNGSGRIQRKWKKAVDLKGMWRWLEGDG